MIQQGGLVESDTGSNREEMLAAIRYGADAIFRASGKGELADEDIDAALAKAETRTKDLMEQVQAAAAAKADGTAGLDTRQALPILQPQAALSSVIFASPGGSGWWSAVM